MLKGKGEKKVLVDINEVMHKRSPFPLPQESFSWTFFFQFLSYFFCLGFLIYCQQRDSNRWFVFRCIKT